MAPAVPGRTFEGGSIRGNQTAMELSSSEGILQVPSDEEEMGSMPEGEDVARWDY